MSMRDCYQCNTVIDTNTDCYYSKNHRYFCKRCFQEYLKYNNTIDMQDVNFKFEFNVDKKLQEILDSDKWKDGLMAFVDMSNNIKKIKTDIRLIKKELKLK